ncbi:MAG: hypothetical protein P1U58_03835 [Verrucomicrobiales bacterium]|nr:hypothetical protein [Verrucomicrobiales bacterium]
MFRCFIVLLFFVLTSLVQAWDADDETFDPTVFETIIDGASRLGDPSPFYREGYEERGFTNVGFSKQEDPANSTVNLTFILMPRDDDPAKLLGGALFLPAKAGEALADALEAGSKLEKSHTVTKGGWMGDWTLTHDPEAGMVFKQEKDGQSVTFTLGVPAAKKLAGALRHSLAGLAE